MLRSMKIKKNVSKDECKVKTRDFEAFSAVLSPEAA